MKLAQYKYKLSKYNVFYQNGDIQYMWNTYSNALIQLEESGQKYIQTFSGIDDESNEFKMLKDNGFIVYQQLDEFGRICVEEKLAMYNDNPDNLSFVIAPGTGCNYSCSYCFEASADKASVMTPEIANEVAEFICNQLKDKPNATELHIRWFGGEPLLYVNTIEIISQKVIKYAQHNNIKYSASILTNGRFLDEATLVKLQNLCIERLQITVDGTRDVYIKSKGASQEDFDCVMDNICNSATKIKTVVRLNIPNNDADKAIAISDYLLSERKLLGKIRVYFAYVCNFLLPQDPSKEAYKNYTQNYFLWESHMLKHYSIARTKFLSLTKATTNCGLIKVSNICIGPNGEFYKCEHSFGIDSMIIGNIWQGRFFNLAERAYYTMVDDPIKIKCSQCEYLPVCMGGCANDHITGFVCFDCENYKQFLYRQKLLEGGIFI